MREKWFRSRNSLTRKICCILCCSVQQTSPTHSAHEKKNKAIFHTPKWSNLSANKISLLKIKSCHVFYLFSLGQRPEASRHIRVDHLILLLFVLWLSLEASNSSLGLLKKSETFESGKSWHRNFLLSRSEPRTVRWITEYCESDLHFLIYCLGWALKRRNKRSDQLYE
jgi:hypothetical protein